MLTTDGVTVQSGEVAFARVEHELPVPPDAFGQFAAELADVRLEV